MDYTKELFMDYLDSLAQALKAGDIALARECQCALYEMADAADMDFNNG